MTTKKGKFWYSLTLGYSKLDIFSAFHPHVYSADLANLQHKPKPSFLCPPTRRPHGRWLPRRSSPALPDDAAACRCAGSAPEMADMPRGTATIDLRLSRGRHSRPRGWPWQGPRKETRSARSSRLHAWPSCLAACCGTSAGSAVEREQCLDRSTISSYGGQPPPRARRGRARPSHRPSETSARAERSIIRPAAGLVRLRQGDGGRRLCTHGCWERPTCSAGTRPARRSHGLVLYHLQQPHSSSRGRALVSDKHHGQHSQHGRPSQGCPSACCCLQREVSAGHE